jgi:hypothetical protein
MPPAPYHSCTPDRSSSYLNLLGPSGLLSAAPLARLPSLASYLATSLAPSLPPSPQGSFIPLPCWCMPTHHAQQQLSYGRRVFFRRSAVTFCVMVSDSEFVLCFFFCLCCCCCCHLNQLCAARPMHELPLLLQVRERERERERSE